VSDKFIRQEKEEICNK